MRLGTSTTMAFNRPHGVKADIPAAVRVLAEAGFKVQDMNFHDCANFPTPLLTEDWERWIDEIGNTAAKCGVEFSQSHLHFYEHMTADPETARQKEIILERCMRGSAALGVKWAVTHAATAPGPQMRADSLRGNVAYFSKSWNWRTNWALALPLKTFGIGTLRPANGIPASRMNWWSWWMHCTPQCGHCMGF